MPDPLPFTRFFTPAPPDGTRMGKVDVYRPSPSRAVKGVILSRRVWGFFVHWYGTYSGWCNRDVLSCLGCCLRLQRQWRGYLLLRSTRGKPHPLLEVTDHQALDWRPRLLGEHPGIRGYTALSEQLVEHGRKRGKLSIIGPAVPEEDLPPDEDLADRVNRLWGGTVVVPSPANVRAYRLQERGSTRGAR